MAEFGNNEFAQIVGQDYQADTMTQIRHDGGEVSVETGVGEMFRAELRYRAAEAAGLPVQIDFAGEFDMAMSQSIADRVTMATMAVVFNRENPVISGTKMALTGVGMIAVSRRVEPGLYIPMLFDGHLNMYGTLLIAGVEKYPFADAEQIEQGEISADTEPEVCKGVIALLDRLEIRDAETGFLVTDELSQARVPIAVDELSFHRIPDHA